MGNTYILYIHTNIINGKKYVGITCAANPNRRWDNGRGYKPHKNAKPTRFWNAIQKYGWENFTHEVRLTGLTKQEAKEREIFYISLLHTTDERYGYNISQGGESNNFGKDAYSPEYKKSYAKQYYQQHKGELLVNMKQRYIEHKGERKEYDKKTRGKHKEFQKQYYLTHHEEILEKRRREYMEHREKRIEYQKQYNKRKKMKDNESQ